MRNKWLTFATLLTVAIMMNASMSAQQQKVRTKSEKSIDMLWDEMGPSNMGGRTRAVLIDKNNSNTMFAGAIAGGLWKSSTAGYSWSKVAGTDMLDDIAISTIFQSPNGDLYFGTGEYFGYDNDRGFKGKGIWKSTDNGSTWTQLSSTNTDDFSYVIKITGTSTKIYAATYKGIRVSTDGGTTWTNPIDATDANYNMPATDIETIDNGSVVVASLNNNAYVCNTGDDVFVLKSSATSIPATDVSRLEFAIAPSNTNYIYCLAVNNDGKLKNLYKSTDKGTTWAAVIANVTGQFQPFGTSKNKQGKYFCSVAVSPINSETVFIGGINLYRYSPETSFEQLTLFQLPTYSSKYVHENIHAIKFSPNFATDNTLYVGTDGGIFRSNDGGTSWVGLHHNYNTMSFTSVGVSTDNKVLGGTIHNGLLYNNLTGTTHTDFAQATFSDFSSGIIGSVERSNFNPDFMIASIKYGRIYRSNDGNIFSRADTTIASTLLQKLGLSDEPLITPLRIFENFYDTSSTQTILFKADTLYHIGDTIKVINPFQKYLYHIINTADLHGDSVLQKKDTVYVKNTFQSLTAVGLNKHVWISWEATNPSFNPPKWFPVTNNSSIKKIQTLEFSADGNIIYFADYDSTTAISNVYRLSNIQSARDSLTAYYTSDSCVVAFQKLGTFIGKISSIAVDPNNSNNLVLTLSDYNLPCHIYYATNAAINSEAEILTFSIPNQVGTSTITSAGGTVAIVMPYGTDLTHLTPTITVSDAASIIPASGVIHDFTNPVTYIVTAEDGTITKTWTVTVTLAAPSSAAKILTFSIPNQLGTSTITNADSTVKIVMPYGTDLTHLTPTITVSTGATINPTSGVAQDFTNSVPYVVTAQNGTTTRTWTVTVTLAAAISTEAEILSFSIPNQVGATVISSVNGTVTAVVYRDSLIHLKPTITVSNGASVSPASGVIQDFTHPVSYLVKAQDGITAKIWTVTVTKTNTPSSEAEILTFAIPNQVGTSTITSADSTVKVVMPYGTNLTHLTPKITISNSASINPASDSTQDFTNPFQYIVKAQDTTITKIWTVTVTYAAPDSEAEILTFSIPNQVGTSTITSTDSTVKVVMPYGTNLTHLTPTITVSTGATINPASGVPQDFTNPVSYIVKAQDTITTKTWTVTVTNAALSPEAKILTYSIPGQVGTSTIVNADSTVKVFMPYGTDLSHLTPTITVSTGATINPSSGVAQDFTHPVSYVVTAQNGTTTKTWTVIVAYDATSHNFAEKQGNFANMPVYSAIVLWDSTHKAIILGTEKGIWATEDITSSAPTWVEQNTGMARVPVSQIRQQLHKNGWMSIPGYIFGGLQTDISNHGIIYASTMGRGIFRCETFKGPINVPENNLTTHQSYINVYPNPAQDITNIAFELKSDSPVQISILNMNGQLLSVKKWNRLSKGNQTLQIPVSHLASGIYIISVKSNNGMYLSKLIKN
jgi:photosystem II stability/assembly factor-like uncharacterized protein